MSISSALISLEPPIVSSGNPHVQPPTRHLDPILDDMASSQRMDNIGRSALRHGSPSAARQIQVSTSLGPLAASKSQSDLDRGSSFLQNIASTEATEEASNTQDRVVSQASLVSPAGVQSSRSLQPFGLTGSPSADVAQNLQSFSPSESDKAPLGLASVWSLFSTTKTPAADPGLGSLVIHDEAAAAGMHKRTSSVQTLLHRSTGNEILRPVSRPQSMPLPNARHPSSSSVSGTQNGTLLASKGKGKAQNETQTWANIVGGMAKNSKRMNLQFIEPSLKEGTIHVSPTYAAIEDGAQAWTHSFVGYFIGSKLPFSAINSIARKIWAKDGLMDVLAQNNKFFFFRFSSEAGMTVVLDRGPWLFTGRYLALKKWESGLKLYKDPADKIPVWIQMYNIPL